MTTPRLALPVRPGHPPRSGRWLSTAALLLAVALAPHRAAGQTQIQTTIDPTKAASVVRIAIPFPELAPGLDAQTINNTFFGSLTRDVAYSGIFAIAPLPPGIPATPELAKEKGVYLLKLSVLTEGEEYAVEGRLYDTTGAMQLGKRYKGPAAALPKIAHTIANDLLRAFNGKPGIFLSQLAFASDRAGVWEIYLMDWDGANQRRITTHNALSILPSWSPDNERMVYTSFARGTSDLYIVNRRGGGRMRIHTGLGLNTSATFSPVGSDIAFVGSVNGNPDIYLIKDDGTNLRRLTTSSSIESTPEWSPNGRQISFTSGRSGSPQIYLMDAEGTNVRRISFEGEWNDDATWSPDGEQIAYTSRVGGRFQIRIVNVATGASRIVAGEGSNEQPCWSPDGNWIAFQSNRSGKWQVYRMRADGNDLLQLTFEGENKEPDWSKKPE
jgi:TolB protein